MSEFKVWLVFFAVDMAVVAAAIALHSDRPSLAVSVLVSWIIGRHLGHLPRRR